MEIRVTTSQPAAQVQQAINAAFQRIALVQRLMSFHDENSELSNINRRAFKQALQVHPLSYAVLQRANRVFMASGGLFDCSVADTLVGWKLLPQHSFMDSQAGDVEVELEAGFYTGTQADVCLHANHYVSFKKPLLLDLGGIAKGFAIDLAIHTLRQHGISQAVVNAGGDLRVSGNATEEIWVKHPANPQQILPLGQLSNGACATSAIYYSQQQHHQQQVSALVHPVNRVALNNAHSYSVIAPSACMADALTKVVALSNNAQHPCLGYFGATAIIID